MKKFLFLFCLFFSFIIPLLSLIVIDSIQLDGYLNFYIFSTIGFIYIILLLISVIYPIKLKKGKLYKFVSFTIIFLYSFFTFYLMSVIVP